MQGDTLVIDMNPRAVKCGACRCWTDFGHGIPTFNGDIVSNEFPDHLWHQGGGSIPVCERCYAKHATGKMATRDEWYSHLFGECIDGAGI